MPEPQLLVGDRDQLEGFGAPAQRHLQVEGAAYMQRFEIGKPGIGDLVIRPASGNRDRDFVFVVTLEGPLVRRCESLDHVDRMFTSGRAVQGSLHFWVQ